MTWLVLVRHGPTGWNAEGRIQGHTDIPLSPEGRCQVSSQALPGAFASFQVVSSPLVRARETAALLNCEVRTLVPELMEMCWGEWEGATLASLRAKYGERVQVREDRGLDFQPPGGESPRLVQQRLRPWFRRLADEAHPTVGFTHKGVIRATLAMACRWNMLGPMPVKLDWRRAQLFRIAIDGRPELVAANIPLAHDVHVPQLTPAPGSTREDGIDGASGKS
jgi:probable phosphoglycerate mutase